LIDRPDSVDPHMSTDEPTASDPHDEVTDDELDLDDLDDDELDLDELDEDDDDEDEDEDEGDEVDDEFGDRTLGVQEGDLRSGFIAIVGRPNVGKSTLLNAICGSKVSIVSDKPQTTRTRVRGVLTRPGSQLVFVDTPGLHKAVTALGERVNATALDSMSDVDAVMLVIDATAGFGTGDEWVASRFDVSKAIVVLNKIDRIDPTKILAQLNAVSKLGAAAYFPVSARTGDGVGELVAHLVGLMPEGPMYFPDDVVRDLPEPEWVAELVREQLLAVTRDELPYSIATRVTEWEWPRVRCEIIVERDSQKGMVIGKKGAVLKEVGTLVRKQLPEGVYIELFVKVDKDWQRKPDRVERLGY
jgi:GTP-binding protein Era